MKKLFFVLVFSLIGTAFVQQSLATDYQRPNTKPPAAAPTVSAAKTMIYVPDNIVLPAGQNPALKATNVAKLKSSVDTDPDCADAASAFSDECLGK